jgi:hypothetical protein
MNSDFMYTCVIDSTWFFLASWMVLLIGTGIRTFRQDIATPKQK